MNDPTRSITPGFVLRTAWRDSRAQWRQWLGFTASIVTGIAALVAILSFRSDVLRTVDRQARDLLTADLVVESTQPFSENSIAWMDSLSGIYEGRRQDMVELTSMVLYGSGNAPRLTRVRAVEPGYPFAGDLSTAPERAVAGFKSSPGAIVERSYMRELGLAVGDSVRVGRLRLPITAELLTVPGESDAFSLIGPRIYIPYDSIFTSELLQRGSRVEYRRFYEYEAGREDPAALASDLERIRRERRDFTRGERLDVDTVESRKEDFDEIISGLSKFLGLIGFIALLLGGLGVGSSIHVYIRRRLTSIASLRCLGVNTRQLLGVFLLQISSLGLIGGLAGSLIGLGIQGALPVLLSEFLPFSIEQGFTPSAVGMGLAAGLLVSLSFAVLPIVGLTRVSPLLALRVDEGSSLSRLPAWLVGTSLGGSLILITLTLGLLLEDMLAGALFTIGMVIAAGVLALFAAGLTRLVRSLRLGALPYVLRQSISNLHRPNNQSTLLMTTLGMGMLIIGTMILSRDILLERIQFSIGEDQPDLILYDIQQWQNDGVNRMIEDAGYRPEQNVPIVSMRLSRWKGIPIRTVQQDSAAPVSRWALGREYRVSYRDSLNPAETLLEGEWIGTTDADGMTTPIPISVSDDIVEELRLSLGDSLEFDVQGVPMLTKVASIRQVDFQRPEPNFFVLFPAGVLEPAPQFFATTVFVGEQASKIALQSAIVAQYPNVSAIDISAVLVSVRAFLDKIASAIQFMAGFSILTGVFVLAGALSSSRTQRIRESVLLRTLGASSRQIRWILILEVALIGVLAMATGVLLSLAAGWSLAVFFFKLPYVPDIASLSVASVGLILMTGVVGWMGARRIVSSSPLQILRSQAS